MIKKCWTLDHFFRAQKRYAFTSNVLISKEESLRDDLVAFWEKLTYEEEANHSDVLPSQKKRQYINIQSIMERQSYNFNKSVSFIYIKSLALNNHFLFVFKQVGENWTKISLEFGIIPHPCDWFSRESL